MSTIASLLGKIGFTVDKKPLEGIKGDLEGIKSRLEVLGAAELAHKVFEMAEQWGHFAEQLGIAATSAGITVEALQKLQYSAGLAGVGADEVSIGMAHLTRTLSEARAGSQEAVAAFASVGIGQAQLNSFKTSQEALAAFSDGMSHVTDSIKRQDLAFKVLGRGAVNMVEWVSQGSEAIKQQGTDAERLAAIIDGNTIQSLRDMEDAMSSLFTTFKAFAATVVGYVAPAIRVYVNSIQEAFAANQGFIKTKFKDWAVKLAFVIGFIIGFVEGLTERFIAFAKQHPVLVERTAEVVGALLALSAVLATVGLFARALGIGLDLVKGGLSAIALPTKLAWGALDLLKGALSWVLLGLGRLVTFLFPQLGAWITRIGLKLLFSPLGTILLQITAVAAAIFAVGAAAYTAWEMFHGKKFEDTWLGGLWKKSGDIMKSIKGFLGFGDEGGVTGEQASGQQTGFLRTMDDMATSQAYLAEQGRGPLANTPQMAQEWADRETQRIFNINAPITVNAPAGADAPAIAKSVKDVLKQQMDTMQRQTGLALNNGNRAW